MIKIVCDKTGTEEALDTSTARIEPRQDRNGEWYWEVHGIGTLTEFTPDAANNEFCLLLSKQAKSNVESEIKAIKDKQRKEINDYVESIRSQKPTPPSRP